MTSILIIENNPDTAESLARFLRIACDCTVSIAADGLSGLHFAEAMHPDVVVCDIGLRKRNGLLVAEELTDLLPQKPLLIGVTGCSNQLTEGIAHDVGFDFLLEEPADPFVIQALIEAHAEGLDVADNSIGSGQVRPSQRSGR